MSAAQRIVTIEGRALPLRGDDIDTDRIVPARFLKSVSFDGLEGAVFIDERAALGGRHPFDDTRFAAARVLVVQSNFGCGSSREHAPQALYRWGIRAIVGVSFSDIFFGNAALIGLPCVTAPREDVDALMTSIDQGPDTEIRVDLEASTCSAGTFSCAIALPPHARDAFVSGAWDTTGLLLDDYGQVRAVAARLPYLTDFSAVQRA